MPLLVRRNEPQHYSVIDEIHAITLFYRVAVASGVCKQVLTNHRCRQRCARRSAGYHRHMFRHALIALLIAFSLTLSAALRAEGLPDLGESAQDALSPLTEKKVGEATMRDIRLHETSYLDDVEVTDYLNRIGRSLTAQLEDKSQSFEFFALRDPMLNAFAMPGGYIGVHTGLLVAAQTESELASVLAHEISHVSQRHLARMIERQSQGQWVAMLAMAAAILAARNNPDVAMGAAMAGQAGAIQNQLNYSRDFEREADRIGLQLLDRAGYDIRDMAAFFERLQKFGRLYENNAPGYLRTHPLTTERIADMNNRIQQRPYHQVTDSTDFALVQAKLHAMDGEPAEAVARFEQLLAERRFKSEAAVRYGLARAQLRAKNVAAAEGQMAELRRLKVASPLLESLAADIRSQRGDAAGALRLLRDAVSRYPASRALLYARVSAQIDAHQAADALKVIDADLQGHTTDFRLRTLQARAYAMLGQGFHEHWALGESYALQGLTLAAIDQFQLAQKSQDGDFYERSQVDARLRELKDQMKRDLERPKP